MIASPQRYLTFQLRAYAPTGEAFAGLGTAHASLEPGLLYFDQVTDRINVAAELRPWIPLGGSSSRGVRLGEAGPPFFSSADESFAGEIIRYGLGVSYDLIRLDEVGLEIAPVFEVVGWEVLSGFKVFTVNGGKDPNHTADRANGDSIVNAKLGLRISCESGDSWYLGYGRALTEDIWYQDTIRLEYRRAF